MILEEMNTALDDLYCDQPSLKPFLGSDYGNGRFPKTMIILESHFLANEDKENISNYDSQIVDDKSRNRQPISDWYELGQVGFEKKYKISHEEYYHTSDIVKSIIEVIRNLDINTLIERRGHKNILIPILALCSVEKQPLRGSSFSESLKDKNEVIISLFDSLCILNYFYRPFFKPTNNLRPLKDEKSWAKNRLSEVIQIVNPEIIIICTSYVDDSIVDNYLRDYISNTTVIRCKHPSSRTRAWKKGGESFEQVSNVLSKEMFDIKFTY